MAVIELKATQQFIRRGDKVKEVYIIVKGAVRQITRNDEFVLENGCIIGMMESGLGAFICDYVAKEDTVIVSYPYRKPEDYKAIFQMQPQYAYAFVHAAIIQCQNLLNRYIKVNQNTRGFYLFSMEKYQDYQNICQELGIEQKNFNRIEFFNPLTLKEHVEKWELEYNLSIAQRQPEALRNFYEAKPELCIGEIMHASKLMCVAVNNMETMLEYLQNNKDILLNESRNDLLELFFDLAKKAAGNGKDILSVHQKVQELQTFIEKSGLYPASVVAARFQEYKAFDFENYSLDAPAAQDDEPQQTLQVEGFDNSRNLLEEDCLEHILTYAKYDETEKETAKKTLKEFRTLPDMLSTDDDVRKLRRQVANVFYDVYTRAFFRSMEEKEAVSPIMQMFFNFGFMDVSVIGEENATMLYDLTERLYQCRSAHVYTIYDWLKAVYNGEKEPSKNEFDLDYAANLLEMRKAHKITKEQEKVLAADRDKKVKYELDNMFKSTNRATYGKVSTFCPVLCEHDIINSLDNMLVTAKKIENALDAVREIDFSLFYREVMFSDPEHGINNMGIQKEVLPDIILMPNAGSKAMMWQETAGVKRDTPARFIFPILTVADIGDMMIETAGRFRWEICRKIQGMRWNDIREKSLTAEYCDYLQFYRKNRDLSTDAKEKVKNALVRGKNNYREVFARDYQSWIKYEAVGSFRLNKVARDIIFRYCPFSKSIREDLVANPMYHDMFAKYEILNERALQKVLNFNDKYIQNGGEMTPELEDNLEFYRL